MNKLLKEGGNAFKDAAGSILTQRINRKDVLPTVQWLEKVTELELTDYMLGTTGKNATSGDLDIAIDANKVDKNEFAERLSKYIIKQGGNPKDWVKKSGISVHFKTPILGKEENGFVQADFMFGEPEWMKFSMKGEEEGSNYKGSHRHILLASIAKAKGMKWSFQNGLINRETNEVIAREPNEIAKKLLGQMTTEKDLDSVNSILKVIMKMPNYEELVAEARETLAKDGVELPKAAQLESHATGTPAWFRRMMEATK